MRHFATRRWELKALEAVNQNPATLQNAACCYRVSDYVPALSLIGALPTSAVDICWAADMDRATVFSGVLTGIAAWQVIASALAAMRPRGTFSRIATSQRYGRASHIAVPRESGFAQSLVQDGGMSSAGGDAARAAGFFAGRSLSIIPFIVKSPAGRPRAEDDRRISPPMPPTATNISAQLFGVTLSAPALLICERRGPSTPYGCGCL